MNAVVAVDPMTAIFRLGGARSTYAVADWASNPSR